MIGLDIETSFGDAYRRVTFTHADLTRLATAAMRGMTPYVPMATGQLSMTAHVEGPSVIYDATQTGGGTSYASYVYYNKRANFNRSLHPKATSEWAEAYSDAGAKEVVMEAEGIIDGR